MSDDEMAERVARAAYIAQYRDKAWGASVWDDMGGDDCTPERFDLVEAVRLAIATGAPEPRDVIAEVRALCEAIEYRVPGDHDTWDAYNEGMFAMADEVLAVIDGGSRDHDNLQTLCQKYRSRKGGK